MKYSLKSWTAFLFTLILTVLTTIPSVKALTGHPVEYVVSGLEFFGDIRVSVDALSAWFILIINFTMLTGSLYGIGYMDHHRKDASNMNFFLIIFVLFHLSMLAVCSIQNGMGFLVAWEVMSLASFFLVIFEHEKPETLKAGLNYLVQMHLSMVLLTIGVIWMYVQTGSFDFSALSALDPHFVLPVFLFFFVGFAFKAGFNLVVLPLHTWLPRAHPAAPSHISAIMSGVMIKIGIFGILRIIQLLPFNDPHGYLVVGWGLLAVSLFSGLYGVMQAIVQHDLKKLLAYHSIENIGIIGIGIGLGCLGQGYHIPILALAGYSGALLHSLNHSLFKSLLFYSAGNIYHAVRTLHIESLGGLLRGMPHTSFLFLLAALAICGLPPLNGFISEFIIYAGLYQGVIHLGQVPAVLMVLSIIGLALIGGLAILCFTKAFGIIFLGQARSEFPAPPKEVARIKLIPMYITAAFILFIGLFPAVFFQLMEAPVAILLPDRSGLLQAGAVPFLEIFQEISRAAFGFILLSLAIYGIRLLVMKKKSLEISETWGCGYTAPNPRMQYTANSFVRKYRKLAGPVLSMHQEQNENDDIFPLSKRRFETHPSDRMEDFLITAPVSLLTKFLGLFRFIQNGKIQYYILYGLIFLLIILVVSLISSIL